MKTLLNVARKVQEGGKHVTEGNVAARAHGATDREIHDIVLIAALLLYVQPLRGRFGYPTSVSVDAFA
jgi:hypothetical protein